jgi:hypothetical protein
VAGLKPQLRIRLRKAAASLRRRITTAYAGAAHKQFALNSESVWSIDLADPEGHGRSTARIPWAWRIRGRRM